MNKTQQCISFTQSAATLQISVNFNRSRDNNTMKQIEIVQHNETFIGISTVGNEPPNLEIHLVVKFYGLELKLLQSGGFKK